MNKVARILKNSIQYAYGLAVLLINPLIRFRASFIIIGVLLAFVGLVLIFNKAKHGILGRIVCLILYIYPVVLAFKAYSNVDLFNDDTKYKFYVCGICLLMAFSGYNIKNFLISNNNIIGNVCSIYPYGICFSALSIVFSDIKFPEEISNGLYKYGSIALLIFAIMALICVTESIIHLTKWRKKHGRDIL